MCRAAGRRCPSSNPSGEARAALNAHRRALYAAKKAAIKQKQESIKTKESETVLVVDNIQAKKDAAMNKALKGIFNKEEPKMASKNSVIDNEELTTHQVAAKKEMKSMDNDNLKDKDKDDNSSMSDLEAGDLYTELTGEKAPGGNTPGFKQEKTLTHKESDDIKYQNDLGTLKKILADSDKTANKTNGSVLNKDYEITTLPDLKKTADKKVSSTSKKPAAKKTAAKKTVVKKSTTPKAKVVTKKTITAKHKKDFIKGNKLKITERSVIEVTKLNKEKYRILDKIFKKDTEHHAAVLDYIGDDHYKQLNQEMRENDSIKHLEEMTDAEFEEKHGEYIDTSRKDIIRITKNLDDYLKDFNDGEEKIVYRGIVVESNQPQFDTLKEGDSIDFKSFSSTSTNLKIARSFSNGTVFEMKTKKGAYIAGVEEEVILPRNTRWRVAGQKDIYVTTEYTNNQRVRVIQLVEEELLD